MARATNEPVTDWRLIENEREKYAAYLCSREWSVKRERVRKRAENRCERCLVNSMDACHHLTYERKYDERLEDLQATCNGCHAFTHGKSDEDPAEVFWIKNPRADGLICPICDAYVYWIGNFIEHPQGPLAVETVAECQCIRGHCLQFVFFEDEDMIQMKFRFRGADQPGFKK